MDYRLLYFLFFLTLSVDANPIVQTLSGQIKGRYSKSYKGREIRSFEGIPYAKPPVGNLRFQPPEPFPEWEGVLLAVRPESECLQHSHKRQAGGDLVHGAEDCLYLNIYSPVPENSTKLLPVILYIHSGAFQFGAGNDEGPEYLVDREVVYINLNYRLGPLGFLSTGNEVVPGNMGLKDQNMALQWISKNIQFFGGNPGEITLTGLSAGAASVHYHYLSPMSRGLFHRGISLSGTALDCWTQTENSSEKAKKLGDIMGCPTSNTERMIKCLMNRPAKNIVQRTRDFMPWLYNPYTPFGPVVEVNSSNPFIDRSPIDIITEGDAATIPWITSVVSEEGLYPAAEFVADEKLLKELNENWNSIAPHLLDFNFTIPLEEHTRIAQKIKKYYLGDKEINKTTVQPLIQMIGDRLYVADAVKASRLMSHRNNVWFLFYSYRGEHSLSNVFIPSKEDMGVSHSDDNILIAYSPSEPVTTKKDLEVQKILLDIWESFVTTGTPNAGFPWSTVNGTNEMLDYLHIAGPDDVRMEKNSNLGMIKFWEKIDFNENKINLKNFS